MITVEFRDFDDMVTFAKRLVMDTIGKHETLAERKAAPIVEVQKEEKQPDPVPEEQNAVAEMATQDEEPKYSLEQVRARLAELQKAGKRAEVKALLNGFGVAKLSEVAPEQYGELMAKAGEI